MVFERNFVRRLFCHGKFTVARAELAPMRARRRLKILLPCRGMSGPDGRRRARESRTVRGRRTLERWQTVESRGRRTASPTGTASATGPPGRAR